MAGDETTPWDVYREIHKAMRFALSGVTQRAGAADAGRADDIAALVAEWERVRFVLEGHHGHEDAFCDPLVRAHAADLRDELEAAHEESDRRIAAIDAQCAALAAGATPAALQRVHLDLADFAASYSGHLRFEEDRVMPALNAALADDELEALTNEIRGSVPPDDMCVFIAYMIPAMNFTERVGMLGGMHQGAPPEIFEMFRSAAEAALAPDSYRAVAVAGGFAPASSA